jgi:ribosomal protein L11 methylase PrmA
VDTIVKSDQYDELHGEWAITERGPSPWYISVNALLPDLSGLRILELGCGRGDLAISIGTLPQVEVIGVDFSTVAVQLARERANRNFV